MGVADLKSSIKHILTTLKSSSLNENAPSVSVRSIKRPFYYLVPKDPVNNLIYRESLLDLAEGNERIQEELYIACQRDLLFFVNVFCWVFEPRKAVDLPFITWPFQDRVFWHMNNVIGKKDMGIEKSRDMGLTWIYLTVFFWRWMFRTRQTFGLVSRTEDLVDKTDDPDTLFWKLDFHYDRLPHWMRPRANRVRLSFRNLDTDSVITGYSATGDVARGGRKVAFGMDEMASWRIDEGNAAWASTQHVTESRIAPSTPRGKAGIFAQQMHNKSASMLKVSVHWMEHPDKVKGLYRSLNGDLEMIDTDYPFPADYPFVLDGKIRSPWYDNECARHPVPQLIAQELDIDYGGSGFPFFNSASVSMHAKEFACKPYQVGYIDYDPSSYEPKFREVEGGPVRLWLNLTIEERPSRTHDYVIGCDIATGTGGEFSTNSVASVIDKQTGEKVCEYAISTRRPDEFADDVIALRKWFIGPSGVAFVIWEDNGPGSQFSTHFMRHSPERVYFRENMMQIDGKATKTPGWYSSRALKRVLLGDYARAISNNLIVNHSAAALEEMTHYIHGPDGSIYHDGSKSEMDPTSAGENHGDRVIADALATKAVGASAREKLPEEEQQRDKRPPYGSMAWRDKMFEDAMTPADSWL